MAEVACAICNYNKRAFVVNCVQSLMEQTFSDIEIIVADNASTDDSVSELKRIYENDITVVCNTENLGGSGGFNLAINTAIIKKPKYIMLIDNDVVLDKQCIAQMYEYMENHIDVGILGPTVRMMKYPDTVQDLGGSLGEKYNMYGNHFGDKDVDLPDELECDYISTCAAMVRTEAMLKFGIMPEDNFIYWDDVELSKKCQLSGYRTVAINSAKVWHNFQTADVTSFNKYYLFRNRLNFWSKYVDESEIYKMVDTLLEETFVTLYGLNSKGERELFDATVYALDDFIHMVRGKAADYKLRKRIKRPMPFEKVVLGKKKICISLIDNFNKDNPYDIFSILLWVMKIINNASNQETIFVSLKKCNYSQEEYTEKLERELERCLFKEQLPNVALAKEEDDYDLEIELCEHVRLVKDSILPNIYVDRYCNCISNEDEYKYFHSYDTMKFFYLAVYKPLVLSVVKKIRGMQDEDNKNTTHVLS